MATPGTRKKETGPAVQDKLHFKYLPAFAGFILENKLEDYARTQLQYSFEENVPLLKFLSHLTEKELQALAVEGIREFLTALRDNKARAYIEKSTRDYIRNSIRIIDREQVVAEDITILTFIRRKTMRRYMQFYTTDLTDFTHIMEEVDRFVSESEGSLFNAFIQVQQENIASINKELEMKQEDLIEAQDLADMGSFLWDLSGQGKSVFTPGVMKIFEMEKTNGLEDFMTYVHEEDRNMLREALEKAFKDGLYECKYRYKRHTHEKMIWSRGIVRFEDGKPISMKGTIMDVTEKDRMLEQLRKSEEANKLSQALTHIGNWSWDIRTNKFNCSDEFYRIYGLEPQSEEFTYDRYVSFIHPEDRDKRIKEIERSVKSRKVEDYLMHIISDKGEVKVLKGKGEVIVDKNNEPLFLNCTCQDITKEHALHQELFEKEEYLHALINNAPDAVVVINEHQEITLWNPKAENVFGWSSAEVLGKTLTHTIIPKKYHKAHLEGMARVLNGGTPRILNKNMELTALKKSGEEFYVSVTISQSIQNHRSSFIGFIRDITDDKQTKTELQAKTELLEKLNLSLETNNAELLRINKELESFNYIASHDLQEPLRKIQTFTHLILEKGGNSLPASTVEYFNKIMHSSARMKLLIEDLLMFSQTIANEDSFEPVDLNLVLDEVKIILSTVIEEKKVRIQSDKLPELRVIPFQIQQLFLNLISNAIKYSRENIPPDIRISSQVVKGAIIQDANAIPDKDYYEFKVMDNGIGFEEENAERIFGLFQRLHNKDKYSGTGIGLAICKKIVHNHQGFISATSIPDKGSTFYVYLPRTPKTAMKKTSHLVN